jgi:comEA protein
MSGSVSPIRQVAAWWDWAVLAVVGVVMLGALAAVLWPAPKAVITLGPVPVVPSQVGSERLVQGEEAAVSEEAPLSMAAVVDAARPGQRVKAVHRPKVIRVVSLNGATLADLDQLPGVGPKLAQRILAYRKGVGRFNAVEEIMGVKGIGPKNFAKMKPYLKL